MTEELEKAVVPTDRDRELARESSRRLSAHRHEDLRVEIPANGREAELVPVPAAAVELLVRILTEMSNGKAMTLIPMHAELTTRQAASILNVSRPFVIKLLEEGKIPYRKVGTHRRIRAGDLLEFKRRSNAERDRILAELVQEAQEQGGY